MSSIVRRFFKTEDHPLISTVQTMFEHRAAADAEARKLAQSIGADKPFWNGSKLGGFSFKDGPANPKAFYLVARDPVAIYMPAANVGTGKKILEEMSKLSVPLYQHALLTHHLFLQNFLQDENGKIHEPQISFNQMSLRVEFVIAGVPFWRLGSPESLTVNRDPRAVSDAPVPEGFEEMSRTEIEEYRNSQQVTVQ